jgi:hypothetical protein
MQRRSRWGRAISILVAFAWAGCYRGSSADATPGDGSDSESAGDDTGSSSGDGGDGPDDAGPADELPGPSTRLFRLTHAQWENTVRDLLYADAPLGLSTSFRVDAKAGPYEFDNGATSLEVDGPLWAQYQRAAVDVAEIVTADAAMLERILPAEAGDETERARAFVISFGRRAFRRPLTDAEVDAHLSLYIEGRDLYDDATGFEAGIRAVIEALLQSPSFLYRIEASDRPDGNVIPLSGYELASRLSYFVWDSMPDDALLDAAEAGALSDASELEMHARRMLDDPRAVHVVSRFHEVVFDTTRYQLIAPNPAFYPDAPEDLAELAQEEFRRFVEHVASEGGGVATLLTATDTFANDRLAALYGVDVAGSAFQRIELDATTRRGLLTQVGFLASHATPVDPDSIHRGVFVAKRLACKELAAPPDNVEPLPSPAEGETNRELVEATTEVAGSVCAGCHASVINPFGYPFEHYDSVGRHRALDNGLPIDATSEVPLDDGVIAVDGAVALADALAASPEVHACYARYWVSYAAGRWTTDEEAPLVARLGSTSLDEQLSIIDLVVEVVVSRPFRARSTTELEP